MTDVQCPICDYVTDLSQAPSDGLVPGLAEALGLTGLSTAQVDYIEKDMSEHLTSHTVADWVTAMRMADTYIERLEKGVTVATAEIHRLRQENESLHKQREMARTMPAPPQLQPGLGVPPPPPGVDSLNPWQFESPRERQDAARARRKAGLSYVPTQTLIPVIPTGQRPEGVVGRKM